MEGEEAARRRRAVEQGRADFETLFEETKAQSFEANSRRYKANRAAKEEQQRLVHARQRKEADREPDKILSQDSSAVTNVPTRPLNRTQSDSREDDDGDGIIALAAFKPRKERLTVRENASESSKGNDSRSKSTVSSVAVVPEVADVRTDRGKARTNHDEARQTPPAVNTKPTGQATRAKRDSVLASGRSVGTLTPVEPLSSRSSMDKSASSVPAKRPSVDEGRISFSSLGKIPKRSSTATPQTSDRSTGQLPSVGNERPPRWYQDTARPTTRQKTSSQVDVLLAALRTQINNCQKSFDQSDRQKLSVDLSHLRDKLHKIVFQVVTPELLKLHRMLHNEPGQGLPAIFDPSNDGGHAWPFDVKADAKELYNKWARRIFETDILRGIKFKADNSNKDTSSKTDAAEKSTGKNNASIMTGYKVDAKYYGNGDLLNGQWWPFQICTLRDGAHGVTQGGICGSTETGAYSCIMAGGKTESGEKYPNEDYGNRVLYCGTDSSDGKPTTNTSIMLASVDQNPVRLIRSSKMGGDFAPSVGFRYDGLYQVVGYENMDGAFSHRQRHRFELVRCEDQDPIRGGRGPEKRPTLQEEEEFEKAKKYGGILE